MSMRVCSTPGCPTLIEAGLGRCSPCRSAHEKQRGTRQERGYDADHDAERKRWIPKVKTGTIRCRRCNELLKADEPFDLGHPDAYSAAPRGPECLPCNRPTALRRDPPPF